MKMYEKAARLSAAAFMALTLSGPATAQQKDCGAILRYGVFEDDVHLDVRYAQKLLRSDQCRSGSTSASYKDISWGSIGFKDKDQFCKSSEDEAVQFMVKYDRTRTASRVLADAWLSCMKEEPVGFTERFHVATGNPRVVRYQVSYNPGRAAPNEVARVRRGGFRLQNLEGCSLPAGDVISRAPITLVCQRINPCMSASITLVTDKGSPHDMAASEVPPPPNELVTFELKETESLPKETPYQRLMSCTMQCIGEARSSGAPRGDCPNGPIESRDRSRIYFGSWGNGECGVSGSGWHAFAGSCGTDAGTKYKRCDRVEVSHWAPPRGCEAPSGMANLRPLGSR